MLNFTEKSAVIMICITDNFLITLLIIYRLDMIMVSVFAKRAVYRGFDQRSGKPKDFKIGIWYCSNKHASLRSRTKAD